MTGRIYYDDPACVAFEAVVERAFTLEGHPAVTLDRTAFYPTSGGQPHDTGTLSGVPVLHVVDLDDGTVAHLLASGLREGVRVEGAVDALRRFDHMQQHTGQHLLSAAFDRLFDNRTVGFHMGGDASTIDLAREASPESLAAAEQEANRVVWEDRPVSIRFVSAEEAASLPLRKEAARAGTLRLIEISDFDLSACGGTHVSRTGAVGMIAVAAWERVRGGTRVTFVCGGRALRLFHSHRDAVMGCVRSLSVLPPELPAAVERIQTESRELHRSLRTLQERLAAHEAARLVAEAPSMSGVRIVARALEGWDAAGLKAVATGAVALEAAAVALVSTSMPLTAVTAASKAVAVDAQAIMQELVRRFGGRGGGRPELAQGGGLSGSPSDVASAARSIIERQLAG